MREPETTTEAEVCPLLDKRIAVYPGDSELAKAVGEVLCEHGLCCEKQKRGAYHMAYRLEEVFAYSPDIVFCCCPESEIAAKALAVEHKAKLVCVTDCKLHEDQFFDVPVTETDTPEQCCAFAKTLVAKVE